MQPDETRVVFKDADATDGLDRIAYEESWELDASIPRTPTSPKELVWRVDDGATCVRFVDDFLIERTYATIAGPQRDAVSAKVRSRIASYDFVDVREEVERARSRDELVGAAYLVGVAAPPTCERPWLELLQRLLSSENSDVRRAVIVACGYLEWPELQSLLSDVESGDPDSGVRDDAALMREGLEGVWKERT
jgi:hypothetical protein